MALPEARDTLMRQARDKAFLGYAVIDLTDEGEFGLTFRVWNTWLPTPKTLSDLKKSLFNEEHGLRWYEENRHVPIVVEKSQVDLSSLVAKPLPNPSSYKRVVWSEDAEEKAKPRYATGGNHRRILLQENATKLQGELAKLKEKFAKTVDKGSETQRALTLRTELAEEIETLEEKIKTRTRWLGAFYDKSEWLTRSVSETN